MPFVGDARGNSGGISGLCGFGKFLRGGFDPNDVLVDAQGDPEEVEELQEIEKFGIAIRLGLKDRNQGMFGHLKFDLKRKTIEIFEKELEAENSKRKLDLKRPEELRRVLNEALRRTNGKLEKTEITPRMIEGLNRRDESFEAAEACFVAAVLEDPQYLPAWFQLAIATQAQQGEEFARAFIKHDPENSLPDYLLAAIHVRENNFEEALTALEHGNSKSTCRWYPPEIPTDFKLRYPDLEPYQEFDLVGQPVTKTVLNNMLRLHEDALSFLDVFPGNLRELHRSLDAEATKLLSEGRDLKAIQYFDALRVMGQHLIRTEPRDQLISAYGSVICRESIRKLKCCSFVQNDPARIHRLAQESRIVIPIPELMLKRHETPTPKLIKQFMTGEKDLISERQAFVERVLKGSGFLNDEALKSNPE